MPSEDERRLLLTCRFFGRSCKAIGAIIHCIGWFVS